MWRDRLLMFPGLKDKRWADSAALGLVWSTFQTGLSWDDKWSVWCVSVSQFKLFKTKASHRAVRNRLVKNLRTKISFRTLNNLKVDWWTGCWREETWNMSAGLSMRQTGSVLWLGRPPVNQPIQLLNKFKRKMLSALHPSASDPHVDHMVPPAESRVQTKVSNQWVLLPGASGKNIIK